MFVFREILHTYWMNDPKVKLSLNCMHKKLPLTISPLLHCIHEHYLIQINHERRQGHWHCFNGAHACEDSIFDTDFCWLSRNEATNMCQIYNQSNLEWKTVKNQIISKKCLRKLWNFMTNLMKVFKYWTGPIFPLWMLYR